MLSIHIASLSLGSPQKVDLFYVIALIVPIDSPRTTIHPITYYVQYTLGQKFE